MGMYFGNEVIFINAYYELGDISVRVLKKGESYDAITIESGIAILANTPFFKPDDPYYILREYTKILIDNIKDLFETSGNINYNPMYNKYDFREDCEFTELIFRYGKKTITKDIVKKVNCIYERYDGIIEVLEKTSVMLRKKLNCFSEH